MDGTAMQCFDDVAGKRGKIKSSEKLIHWDFFQWETNISTAPMPEATPSITTN
jgi:hypothetical protein